ncbi:hypothetical protein lerEdw1_016129 [Lerista edwardsae]|nr:hypothetical protein lerEdw1_016129 [Lerista edwardsae]
MEVHKMWGNGSHVSSESNPATLQCVTEAEFQHLLLPITYSVVCALSLASNSVALWSCWANRARAPPIMIFIYNLIVIDLLFALSLPLQAVYHARRNDWPFGEILCKVTNALFLANMFSCTLFLACICLERYLAVIHPLHYLRLRWLLYRVLLSMVIWALIGIGLLILFSKSTVTSHFPNGNVACMENFPAHEWSGRLAAMVLGSSVLGFFVPFLTIIVCSVVIARRIMKLSHSSAQASSLRRHSLHTLLMVTSLLTLCFLPFHVIHTLHTFGRLGWLSAPGLLQFTCSAQRAAMALASINSALDPLLYYFNMKSVSWKLPWNGTVHWHGQDSDLCFKLYRSVPVCLGRSTEQTPPFHPQHSQAPSAMTPLLLLLLFVALLSPGEPFLGPRGKPFKEKHEETASSQEPCHFPFRYQRQRHDSCIPSSILGLHWCATTENYDRDQRWRYCGNEERTRGYNQTCYSGNGHLYRGVAHRGLSGTPCLPWDSPFLHQEYSSHSLDNPVSLGLGAHAFCRPDASKISVVLGQTLYNISTEDSVKFQVQDYQLHENYSMFSQEHDIALVRLKEKKPGHCAEFSHSILPVCLPSSLETFDASKQCQVAGWGHQYEGANKLSVYLQEADMPLIPHEQCSSHEVHGARITPDMLCAGYLDGRADACQGDSGGPLVCEGQNGATLHGIVSWGTGCAQENKPGVYTNVAHHLDWIQSHMH